MAELSMKLSEIEGDTPVTIIHLTGEGDAENYHELDEKAAGVSKGGSRNIVLDMSNLGFMSSAGFRSMHKIYGAINAGDASGGLRLLKPSDDVRRLIKTMGFDSFVSIHDDLQEAISAF